MDECKIITEPRVYLVSTQVLDDGYFNYLADEGHSEYRTDAERQTDALVEFAGRNCYDSFAAKRPGGNKAYIDHILECGHGSVLEHVVFGVMVAGVSRSLTHELVRHRAGMGYSQRSQRFVDESECEFVIPDVIGSDPDLTRFWVQAVESCQHAYEALSRALMEKLSSIQDKTQRRKAARQAARSVLPNATETKILVTANVRAWRNFLEQRGSIHADAEIRNLAIVIFTLLKEHAPNCFGDIEIIRSPVDHLEVKHHKV